MKYFIFEQIIGGIYFKLKKLDISKNDIILANILKFAGIGIAILGMVLSLFYITFSYLDLTFLGIIIIIISRTLISSEKSWIKGLDGEELVLEYLNRLPESYSIFDDVKFLECREYIDHVVVGPTGVFVIETLNYKGKYEIKGNNWYYYKNGTYIKAKYNSGIQVLRNVEDLKKMLINKGFALSEISLNPIVAITNNNIEIISKPDNYNVLVPEAVPKFILNRKNTQNQAILKKIAFELTKQNMIK